MSFINKIFFCLAVYTLSAQNSNIIDFKMPSFSFTPKVFHHPNKVLFNSKSFELQVFVDFPQNELKTISLFYKTNNNPRFIEILFDPQLYRYVFKYNPKENPANQISYFFTVLLKNGAIYATPVDSTGALLPITQTFVDPVEYYKQRAAYRN